MKAGFTCTLKSKGEQEA